MNRQTDRLKDSQSVRKTDTNKKAYMYRYRQTDRQTDTFKETKMYTLRHTHHMYINTQAVGTLRTVLCNTHTHTHTHIYIYIYI